MDITRFNEIKKISEDTIKIANSYFNEIGIGEHLIKSFSEESEIPNVNPEKLKFGKFQNKAFVVMMTDIRKSTNIINSDNGVEKMFKIFYVYSSAIAFITDKHDGTSTEFLGDGIINLFPTEQTLAKALSSSIGAAQEILEATNLILNPLFERQNLPSIQIGIGIDYGMTIVTRFGHKGDNDLKAFGECVYNISRLCKGTNKIIVSEKAQRVWPSGPNGTLQFSEYSMYDNVAGYKAQTVAR